MNKPTNKVASNANIFIKAFRAPYDRASVAYKKATSKANRRQAKKIIEDEIIYFA